MRWWTRCWAPAGTCWRLAQIESGALALALALALSPEAVRLAPLLEECQQMIGPAVGTRRIAVTERIDFDWPQ